MKGRTILVIAVTVFLMLLLVIIVRTSRTSDPAPSAANNPANSQADMAPPFELKTLDGRTLKLSDLRGKVVVLNFWATWCAPCRVETPWLVELYRQYQRKGLEIVGVSLDDGGTHPVEKFVQEMKVNYPVLMGSNSVSDSYGGLRFLPQTFFIDRDGRIERHTIGLTSRSDLEDDIKRLLNLK
jgi:peroxiredoxin